MALSRKLMLALEAVVDIAYNARPEPVQAKDLTRRQGIPQRYLEQAMQQLVHAGILKGVRGPNGGYVLARERRRITVADVVKGLGSADADAAEAGETLASDLGRKVVQPLCAELEADMLRRFAAVTIEDLCARARAAGLRPENRESGDFAI
jgi:Rrf2 family transcriptional regulator, iron-sulfur cluster assembly transcription factor